MISRKSFFGGRGVMDIAKYSDCVALQGCLSPKIAKS